jgi:sigma-B regulation protein RsbU (phosphoserine phosphatase)
LVKIGSIVAQVGQGNFDVQVDTSRGDEIGIISDQINKMVRDLKEQDRIKRSLYLAQEVQQNLLPQQAPRIDKLEIAGKSIYCDETGGDYYDFIFSDTDENQRIGIAIGDVSGHGISSALLMATVRSSIRQRSSLPGSIDSIVSDVNRQLVDDVEDSGQFMTMFYMVIDPRNMNLQYVRAGHDPAIFYDPQTDTFEELTGSGMALGVDKEWRVKAYTKTNLNAGQIIFLSTDGIWEACNLKGEMFGKKPIYDIIRNHSSLSANDILNTILESFNSFQKGAKIEDDITLVIIKVTD